MLDSISIRKSKRLVIKFLDNMIGLMDYGHPVRKSPSLHGRKSNPNPKCLGTAEADFFDLCRHWVSVVRDWSNKYVFKVTY